jgi:hypothetical protein
MSGQVPMSRVGGWVRTAITKIDRFENEFGWGTVDEMRCSRSRLRAAQTFLRKAAAELGEDPGPAARYIAEYVENLLAAVAESLAEVDAIIAEAEAGA